MAGTQVKWCCRIGPGAGWQIRSWSGKVATDAAYSETGGHSRNGIDRAVRVPRSSGRLGLWLSRADFSASSHQVLLSAKGPPSSPLPVSGRLGPTAVINAPGSDHLDPTAAASRYPASEGHDYRALAPRSAKELASRLRISGRLASRRSGRLASLAAPFWA